jgi:2-keto-4-pentenoate hydratase/2-oxohepta-3-ene-1,7-dioic acid hydratase in catechol pathway
MKTIKVISSSTQDAESYSTVKPSKVICIGRNFVDHVHELANEIPDEMVVFFKPNSAISDNLQAVHLNEALHYEAELCFLYQQGKFVAVAFGLDLTKRSLQAKLKAKGLPWERAKAFDGAVVFSDFISIEGLAEDEFNKLTLSLKINDEAKQQGGVPLMMFKPVEILKDLQSFVTLEDGDVIMTGTPKGVGVIEVGDNYSGLVYIDSDDHEQTKALIDCHWLAQ